MVSFHFNNEGHAFIAGTNICMFVLFSQTCKSILREPRPLMVDPGIKIEDCKHMEFGNPSSHTYGATFCWLICVYLLIRHYVYRYKIKNPGFYVVIALNVTALVIFIMGFSRVYKGVHTYN